MGLTYFKRFRMEIDLTQRPLASLEAPAPYVCLPWDHALLESHALVKFHSFREEIDAHVFPCLGEQDGCRRLMHEIAQKEGFLSGATWLIGCPSPQTGRLEYCGTIQGIRDRSTDYGAVQNLGIVPEHRNRGLGSVLLMRALDGFRRAGLRHAFLEVTARNEGAIRLYRRLGFYKAKTVYKAVEVAYN